MLLLFRLDEHMDIIELISASLFLSLIINSVLPSLLAYLGIEKNIYIITIIIFTLIIGLLSIAIRGLPKLTKTSSKDYLIIFPFFTLLVIMILHLYKYPIFHATFSKDPVVHANFVKQLFQNPSNMTRNANYPLGLHMISLIVLEITRINFLFSIRFLAGYFVILSLFLMYIMVRRMFNEEIALLSTFIFNIAFPIPFIHFSNSGTYANIVGNLASIFIIYWWLLYKDSKLNTSQSIGYILIAISLGITGLWLHFSVFIILTILPIYLLILYLIDKDKKNIIFPLMLWLVIIMISMLDKRLIMNMLNVSSFLKGGPFIIYSSTILSHYIQLYFPWLMLIGYLSVLTGIHVYAILISYLYALLSIIRRYQFSINIMLLLIWSMWILFLSIMGETIRFTFELMLPASIVYSLLIIHVYNKLMKFISSTLMSKYRYISIINKILITVFIVLILTIPLTTHVVINNIKDISMYRHKQLDVLDSMEWINNNLPQNSSIISVGLKEYRYFSMIFNLNIDFIGDFLFENVSVMNKYIHDNSVSYIVLWKKLHYIEDKIYILDELIDMGYSIIYRNNNVYVLKVPKYSISYNNNLVSIPSTQI